MRRRAVAGAATLAMVAQSVVALLGGPAAAATSGAAAEPGTPGVPQDPTPVYVEDFENGMADTPVLLTGYTGAPPGATTYTADAGWLTGCNGNILNFNSTGNGNCSQKGWADRNRQLAWALADHAGESDPKAGHAVTAFTENNPGANKIQAKTMKPVPIPDRGRFLSLSVDYAAQNCTVSAPRVMFSLLDGADVIPIGSEVNACTSDKNVTAPAVPGGAGATTIKVGTYMSNGSLLFNGDSVGFQMVNANGSGTGNDGAFDNLEIIDATPQLDKEFSPKSVPVGSTSTLTFTVTNTSELASKNGWSFTDQLAEGLTVAPGGSSTTCPSGTVDAPEGGRSIEVGGNLNQGMKSCTVSVPVTSDIPGTYENGPDDVTPTGLNPPGDTTVTFTPVTDLDVTKKAEPSPYVPGEKVTYTVEVTNGGPQDAVDATVSDPLPPELTGATWTCTATDGSSCAASGEGAVDDTVTVKKDGKLTYTVTGTTSPDATGDLKNTVTVTPPPGTTDPGCDPNCTSTVVVPPDPKADVVTTKALGSSEAVKPGEEFDFTVTATNEGPSQAKEVGATDPLPEQLAFVSSADGCTGTAGEYGGTVTCGTEATLDPDKSKSWTFKVRLDPEYAGDGTDIENVATATSPTCEGDCDSSPPVTPKVARLEIEKTAEPTGTLKPGDKVAYTVTVHNAGSGTYKGATVTDDLSAALDDAKYNGDASATAGEVAYTEPELSWSGDVPAGETVTLTYSVTVDNPDAGDTVVTNAVVGPPGSNCEDGSDDPKCGTGRNVAQLEVEKKASAATAEPGEDITYTVTVKNTGTATYEGATFTDDLSGVLDDAAYGDDASATAGEVAYAEPELTWTGDLPAGQTATVTYSVTVNTPPGGDQQLKNAVTTPDGGPCEDPKAPGCSTVVDLAVLDIKKTAEPETTHPGGKVAYTVKISNTGTAAYDGATVKDDLTGVLDDAAYNDDAAASAGEVAYAEPELSWSGDVPAGRTVTLTYSVTVNTPPGGDKQLKNAVTGPPGSSCEDPAAEGCSTEVPVAELEFTKTSDASSPKPGDKVTYTVTVENSGTADYKGADFTDDLSGALDDAAYNDDATATSGEVAYEQPKLTWKGDVAAGESATVTYSVTVKDPPAGDHSLDNAIVSDVPGGNCPEGSKDPKCGTQEPLPALKVKKTATPDDPRSGDTITYTVVVRNEGKAPYPGATLTDDLTNVIDDATYNDDATATSGDLAYAEPELTWTGDLAEGAEATLTYTATVNTPASGDGKFINGVSGPGSNCPEGSTDPECRTILPAPEYDFGDAPDSYGTTLGNDGAFHEITDGLRLGTEIEPDKDGMPSEGADADEYEDGLAAAPVLHQHDSTYDMDVRVVNDTGKDALLAGWIDSSGSGTFDGGELATVTVPAGARTATLAWGDLQGLSGDHTHVRLRLYGDDELGTAAAGRAVARDLPEAAPTGFGGAGEVEDYRATVEPTQLVIDKTVSDETPGEGQKVNYTITVSSSGPEEYTGASFTDDLTGVLDDATYNEDATATSGDVSYAAPKLSWKGTVPAGRTVTLTYSVTVDSPDTGDRTLANAVTGPDGSACKDGSEPPCRTTSNVPEPPPEKSDKDTPPDKDAPPAKDRALHSGELPKTGGDPAATYYLGVAAALLLGVGVLLVTAVRRDR